MVSLGYVVSSVNLVRAVSVWLDISCIAYFIGLVIKLCEIISVKVCHFEV